MDTEAILTAADMGMEIIITVKSYWILQFLNE